MSPDVKPDGTITFRYLAPKATEVTVSGELDGKPHPMTKDDDGLWATTVGPLVPDIYTYSFNVDGVVALDPRNVNTKYGCGGFWPVRGDLLTDVLPMIERDYKVSKKADDRAIGGLTFNLAFMRSRRSCSSRPRLHVGHDAWRDI